MSELSQLSENLRNLPDELIKRLDDRYILKDDGEKKFVTRMEGKVVGTIFSAVAVILGIFINMKQ